MIVGALGVGARSGASPAALVQAARAGLAAVGLSAPGLSASGPVASNSVGSGSGSPTPGLSAPVSGLSAIGAGGVQVVATLDRRAEIIMPLAELLGLPMVLFREDELAAIATPHTVRRTGAPSVAEAAALCAGGPGARLVLPKTVHAGVTVAVALFDDPGTGAG